MRCLKTHIPLISLVIAAAAYSASAQTLLVVRLYNDEFVGVKEGDPLVMTGGGWANAAIVAARTGGAIAVITVNPTDFAP